MSNRLVGGVLALAALLFAILLLWGPVSNELAKKPVAKAPVAEAPTVSDAGAATTSPTTPAEPTSDGLSDAPIENAPNPSAPDNEQATAPTAESEPPQESAVAEQLSAPTNDDKVLTAPEPEFDVLRVDASGFALAAGRAAANTDVRIFVGDTLATTARAGADGAFVAYFQTPPAEGAQAVRAETDSGPSDGLASTEPLFILSSAQRDEAPIIIEPAPDGIVVLQQAKRIANDVVSLDQITYDESGRVSFAGRGEGLIVLYLDNQKMAEAYASDDGSWQTQAPRAIEPGIYALRVDQLGNDGAVTSRVETPFQREAIERGDVGQNALTVQAGSNLWRLAEQHYGAGARYTLIFEANRDAIRDPDLIYPGQIFVIPDEKRADIEAEPVE